MRIFKKTFVLAVIIFFPLSTLYSQTPSYYHYTSSDGLASSTVFYALQDKDGFMWFGTLNGLSRFDGKQFTTFRVRDGLNSNVITHLLEGDEGELYITNFEKGINVLKNGRIENYFSEINGKGFSISYAIKFQKKIYAYQSLADLIVLNQRTDAGPAPYRIYTAPVKLIRLAKLSDNRLVALTTTGLYVINQDSLIKMNIKGFENTPVYSLTADSDGSYLVGTKGMISRIKNNSVIKRYKLYDDNEVNQIYKDRNNNIWFAKKNKGAFLIPAGSDEIINIGNKMGLENTQVDNYLEDMNGNIWISTFGKGVYCLNNLYLRNYNEKDGLDNNDVHSILKEKSGKLIIGTFNGINILENGEFYHLKDSSGKALTGDVSGIKNFDDTIYVSWSNLPRGLRNVSYKGLVFSLLTNRSFYKTSDGLYLSGSWSNTIIIYKSLERGSQFLPLTIFGDSTYSNRVYEIIEDSKKNIWVGTGLGLSRISFLPGKTGRDAWQKSFFRNNPVLSSRINSIYQDAQNNIWFAAVKGIARYNLETHSMVSYTTLLGYDVSNSTSIVSDNNNRLWIGTMSGLYLYDGTSIKYLNSQTGLPSDEVLSLSYDNDKNLLYVGTSNGLSFLYVNSFDSYSPPSHNVKIISIKAGDSTRSEDTRLNSSHTDISRMPSSA